jgi:DNA-binding NarL/FixJ family response regulator
MRVAIAEDSGIFRQALVTLLATAGMDVIASAPSGEELITRISSDPPDVVLLDLHMPPTYTNEGVLAARHIKQIHPGVGVLVLSAYNETPQAMALFGDRAQGLGYLLKDHVTDVDNLRTALERVRRGETVIDPLVVARLVDSRQRSNDLQVLSDREKDVLSLMAEGHSNIGIGRRLNLSHRTVEDHVRAIFTKLRINDTRERERRGEDNKRVLAVLAWLRSAQPS